MRTSFKKAIHGCIILGCLLGTGLLEAEPAWVLADSESKLIGGVTLAKTSFNPFRGEALGVSLDLRQPAYVTVRVYDADWKEVAVVADSQAMEAGENRLVWDGKDGHRRVVADEAYFFTVEAKSPDNEVEVYDPTAFSGGEEADLTEARIDPLLGAIRYQLPQMARVNIRIGISGGPLLKTVVDWEPRVAGEVTDYWDGKDLDQLIDLREHPDRKIIISYFTLPATSVITYGNKGSKGTDTARSEDRPIKPDRTGDWAADKRISHHYRIPRAQDTSPQIRMEFPNSIGEEDGAVVLEGRSLVHVDLDAESKRHFQSSKFEIVFYVDGRFYAEEETGYAPYNWVWDTSEMEEGTYLLTVNVASFKDQIGIKSAKVKIVR
jgi:hypothetical protein